MIGGWRGRAALVVVDGVGSFLVLVGGGKRRLPPVGYVAVGKDPTS